MPTCATCKFVLNPGEYARCGEPRVVPELEPVHPLTGFPVPWGWTDYVEAVRWDRYMCGPDGVWWVSAK